MYPTYTICSAGAFCVPYIHNMHNMLSEEHIVVGRYICYFSGRPREHNMFFLKTCLVVCLPSFFLLPFRHSSVYLTNLVSKAMPASSLYYSGF